MNNKVLILSENKYLKEGLLAEAEKLGFKIAFSVSQLDAEDVLIVDYDTVKGFGRPTNKIIYITSETDAVNEFNDACCLKRPISIAELNNMLLALASDFSMTEKPSSNERGLSIELDEGCVVVNGTTIELTKNEMLIFSELWKSKGNAVSREQLDTVIGANRDGNIVTVYINHLREKLSAATEKRIIKTIRGGGYTISEI